MLKSSQSHHRAEIWGWLAKHWVGFFKPDIIINIRDVADTAARKEVLRFGAGNMDTLIVTTTGHSDLSSAQLK